MKRFSQQQQISRKWVYVCACVFRLYLVYIKFLFKNCAKLRKSKDIFMLYNWTLFEAKQYLDKWLSGLFVFFIFRACNFRQLILFVSLFHCSMYSINGSAADEREMYIIRLQFNSLAWICHCSLSLPWNMPDKTRSKIAYSADNRHFGAINDFFVQFSC